MYRQKHPVFFRIGIVMLVFFLAMPIPAQAAVVDSIEPRASDYLVSYTTYIAPVGNGVVQVWFRVTGTGYMTDIGTLSIVLYESTDNENWTWVDTFLHEENPNMLSHNDSHHMSYVEYQGVAGRYYKAYVCIWSGNGAEGDARYMWTTVKQAT